MQPETQQRHRYSIDQDNCGLSQSEQIGYCSKGILRRWLLYAHSHKQRDTSFAFSTQQLYFFSMQFL